MATSSSEDTNMDEVKNEPSESGSCFDHSEYEHTPSFQKAFLPTALDYWYGKKYFEEIIARILFLEAAADPFKPDLQVCKSPCHLRLALTNCCLVSFSKTNCNVSLS